MQERFSHPIGPNELEDYGAVFENGVTLEAITEGDAVYINASGYVGRARANASSTMRAAGVAAEGIASGLQGRIQTEGRHRSTNYDFSGYIGRDVYVSPDSAGALVVVPPSASGVISQVLGVARDRRTILIGTPGQAVSVVGEDLQATSLELIAQGDVLYVNGSGYFGLARSNASSTMRAVGVAATAILSGTVGRAVTHGRFTSTNYGFSGYIGRDAYVSPDTAGGISPTPPVSSGQIVQVVGQMIARQTLLVSLQGTFQRGGAEA